MLRRVPLRRCGLLSALCLTLSACAGPYPHYLQQSQLRTQQLYHQNQHLAAQSQGLGGVAAQNQQLSQENLALKANLDLAQQRLQNLQTANEQLEGKVRDHLTSHSDSPLSSEQTRKLEELRAKYPEFEFDAATGVSKFSTDLLFASGSDEITDRSQQILTEFANIMNQPDAQHLKILVVGHTDDQPIGKARANHRTNWHLSGHRAAAVVLALRKFGVTEPRMGHAGYGEWQPVASNADGAGKQKNRRVEIFVLAPDASIAGWDDHIPLK
jgi:chemotaxis protein MotB